MSIERIAHVCLRVKNLEESIRFYDHGLGFRKLFDFVDKDGRKIGAYLRVTKDSFIEFFETKETLQANASLVHVCFQVDDIEKTAGDLAARGIDVTAVKMGCDHSYQAWTQDPDGNRIEFHEYTEESCQKTGKDCVIA